MDMASPISVYRTLNLPHKGGQLLGADLNRSESGCPLIRKGFYSVAVVKSVRFYNRDRQNRRVDSEHSGLAQGLFGLSAAG
jgi:hypothetical protein